MMESLARIDVDGKRIYGAKFTSLESAWWMVNRATKPQRIIMGDAPYYWVVNNADAQRLIRAGYEMI